MDHFQGKSPFEHIQEARIKTKAALKENHAVETTSFYDSMIRLISESAMFFGLMQIFTLFVYIPSGLQLSLIFSFIFFRTIYCALDGTARLQRLHRVIEEERYEIEHHEAQEKEELRVLYQNKGFEGKLLDDVIQVLMADRNRLLSVMLDEELGLKIEAYEHPLLQSFGAILGGLIVFIPLSLLTIFSNNFICLAGSLLFVFLAAFLKAVIEKISRLKTTVWHLANFLLVTGLLYFGLKSFVK